MKKFNEMYVIGIDHGYEKLMAKLYEDNVLGRVTDDFFQMMMKNYEREQKELTKAVADGEQVLQSSE